MLETKFVVRLTGCGGKPALATYLQSLEPRPMGGLFRHALRFDSRDAAVAALEKCSAENMIGAVHPVESPTTIGEAIADNYPAPTAALLSAAGPKAYIVALASSFPCLRGKVEGCGITDKNWDVDFWMEAQGPWSHGEKVAAVFVACVWNPSHAESMGWRFDVIEAASTWGRGERAAFTAWITKPVFP